MTVYELIRCDIDSTGMRCNDIRIGFFSSPKSVINYLTCNGNSKCKLSMPFLDEHSQRYIEEYMSSENTIYAVHYDACENSLTGLFVPAYDEYYYVRNHQVITM